MKTNKIKNRLQLRNFKTNFKINWRSALEIVKWYYPINEANYCITIAYWIKANDKYYLEFVGDRFLKVHGRTLLKLIYKGQKKLNKKTK